VQLTPAQARRLAAVVGETPAMARKLGASGMVITRDGAELSVFIRGTPAAAENGSAVLLGCLFENIGCVVPFERLALAVGCKSADPESRRHVLRQHVVNASRVLALHEAPYVIAAATNIGYALCEIAAPPTRRR
jgi:hypothetical protein